MNIMCQFTPFQIKIVMLLLDEKGHALWELNTLLGRTENKRGDLLEIIKKLQNKSIVLKGETRKTTNPKSSRPNMLEIPYYLNKDPAVFDSIMEKLIKDNDKNDLLKKFLKSEYTNFVIKEQSFSGVHKIIKNQLALEQIKFIASETLLTQPATINEYNNLAYDVEKITTGKLSSTEMLRTIEMEVMPEFAEQIEILHDFSELEAVRLHRKTLHKGILKAFESFADRNVITKGLLSFMAHDNYLSPLTSYPINGTSQLLFSQPFQRIYEDAYLLDGEMVGILSARALKIYENFSDMLFELFNVDRPIIEDRELMTKEMIFHWNVACTRFDRVCSCLAHLYDRGDGSGNFHLISDGLTFNIIDLENKKPLLPSIYSETILKDGAMPMIFYKSKTDNQVLMKEPWKYLRPSITFEMFKGVPDYIPIGDILGKLESKLAEYDGRST